MKKLLLPFLALATALGLTSCFQQETVVHLNKDGSGSVVEETFVGEQMKAMMAQMASAGGEAAEGAKNPMDEMFSEEKAKAKLAGMGEGVTFNKVEKIKANGKDGYRVTYMFKDINKLHLNLGDSMNGAKDEGEEQDKSKKDEPITFAYADGKLAIHMPKPDLSKKKDGEAAKEDEEADDAEGGQQEAMMKQMMADMKISVKIVADGGFEKTDATYGEGNAITLMEMDFGKLIKDPVAFKKMQKAHPETPEEIQTLLKGVDGVKMETKPEVTATLK